MNTDASQTTTAAEAQSAASETATPKTEGAGTLYNLITRQPFFAGMSPRHLQNLADAAMRTQFEPHQWIFQKGDPANRFYVILGGKIVVETADTNCVVHRVETLGPGDILGWSWMFPPYYWHFDALALEPTDAIFFYGSRIRTLCEKDHEFGYDLMKRMSQIVIARLQTTRRHWIEGK